MTGIYPLTLLYDAACPVCALEMDHLRARNTAARLVFVDISAPGFDPAPYGLTLAALNAEIHAVGADGQLRRGMTVLRLAYEAVGLGWVLRATGWGPWARLFDGLYRMFARHRQAISRATGPLIRTVRAHRARRTLQRMNACQHGVCQSDVCRNNANQRGASDGLPDR